MNGHSTVRCTFSCIPASIAGHKARIALSNRTSSLHTHFHQQGERVQLPRVGASVQRPHRPGHAGGHLHGRRVLPETQVGLTSAQTNLSCSMIIALVQLKDYSLYANSTHANITQTHGERQVAGARDRPGDGDHAPAGEGPQETRRHPPRRDGERRAAQSRRRLLSAGQVSISCRIHCSLMCLFVYL